MIQMLPSLASLFDWLLKSDGRALLGAMLPMPLRSKGKAPMYPHAEAGAWTWAKVEAFVKDHPRHTEWGLLLDTVIAVDADDAETVAWLESLQDPDVRAALDVCPVQATRKGRHYIFLRPPWADDEGYWDGARQVADRAVDLKTRCSTGTRSVLVVAPSAKKSWIRAPWDTAAAMVEIPRALLELVAVPKCVKKPTPPVLVPAPPPPVETTSSVDPLEVRALIAALSKSRAGSYRQWMEVGWCLHNVSPADDPDAFLPDWIAFSRLCAAKYCDGECQRVWATMRNATAAGFRIGSLHMWARQDSPVEYKHIVNRHVFDDVRNSNGTNNDVARIAHIILNDRFVCAISSGKLWYAFNGTRWISDEAAISVRHELSTTVREHFLLAAAKLAMNQSEDDLQSATSSSGDDLRAKMMHIAKLLQGTAFKSCVIQEMIEYFYDREFTRKLDADPNLVGFNNGVWDLKAAAFRPGRPEDRVSLSTGYDYVQDEDAGAAAQVASYWATMHPDAGQRDYVMRMFARQLFGDHGKELFHIHAGFRASASNGKSRFFEILDSSLGDYVRKFGIEMLTAKNRIEPGKPMPEFAAWKGVRILYCTEPNADETLNSGVLKDLTGGEIISYRLLHSSDIVQFRPQFKLHVMCNDAPRVDGSDSGVKRRIRKVDYISSFVDSIDADPERNAYPRDPVLIERFKTDASLRREFARSLLRIFDMEYDFEMPAVVRSNSRLYLEDNDAVHQFVAEWIVKEADAAFTLKEAKVAFASAEYYNHKPSTLKTDLEKALGTPCLAQKRVKSRGGEPQKNVFVGFKLVAPRVEDTSSASERRFREGLQHATGIVFETGCRPEWLRNNATGKCLELDMFNTDMRLAIEYDGPHHYTYPNCYHKTRAEFDASRARDALKDVQCAQHGVALLRVRAVGNVNEEVATCVAAMAARGFGI